MNNSDNTGVFCSFYNFKKIVVLVLTVLLLGDNILIVREGTQQGAENKSGTKVINLDN